MNSDGSNVDPAQPSEIAEFTPSGAFVTQFSVDPNPGGSFGIGLLQVDGGIAFAAVDDNAATATVWNTLPTFRAKRVMTGNGGPNPQKSALPELGQA